MATTVTRIPRCTWCKEPQPARSPYRTPMFDYKGQPIGIMVCTPACPSRPAGAIVYRGTRRI